MFLGAWPLVLGKPRVEVVQETRRDGLTQMFASCLYERFACGVWSDGGIVFDEARVNVNY